MKQFAPGFVLSMLCLMLGWVTPALAEDQTIVIEEYGLEFQLPEVFDSLGQLEEASEFSHSFAADLDDDGEYDRFLFIEPQGALLDRRIWSKSMLPAGSEAVELKRYQWNGFTINGSIVPEEFDGESHLTFNAVFPLIPQAVIFRVTGLAQDRDGLLALTHALVSSVQGETNWSQPQQVASQSGNEARRLALMVIPLGGVVLTGLIYSLWWRRLPRGLFLGMAIVVFGIGHAGDIDFRDQSLWFIYSKLTLIIMGLSGFIFGIWDLFRSRKPHTRKKAPTSSPPPCSESL